MLIYPAIDLINGTCVRLEQGRFDAVTAYDADPFARLAAFVRDGAQWVHIVDLDGARAGEPRQQDLIARLAQSQPVAIQTGGGVRQRAHVESLLSAGAKAVVVGSLCVSQPETVRGWLEDFGPDALTLALDVRPTPDGDFEVATHGWATGSGQSLWAVLDLYPEGLAKRLLVTDVARDGMLQGPNLTLMQAIRQRRPDLGLQASGGVSGLADLSALTALGAEGVIVGKALYEGRFTLDAALKQTHGERV